VFAFTSEKKFSFEVTENFVPGSTIYKYEMDMDTPTSFIMTRFDNGVKVQEYKFKKEK